MTSQHYITRERTRFNVRACVWVCVCVCVCVCVGSSGCDQGVIITGKMMSNWTPAVFAASGGTKMNTNCLT